MTLQIPQIAPNGTFEHPNFKNFLGGDAPRPPYRLAPFGRSPGCLRHPNRLQLQNNLLLQIFLRRLQVTSLYTQHGVRHMQTADCTLADYISCYLYEYILYIYLISINLLAFYHECRSLIGYATHVLFCDR